VASIGGEPAIERRVTCLVTIHGIGFQQPPVGDIPGYADKLHANLKRKLKDLLSDDPGRERTRPGEAGTIYVQSEYPTGTGDRKEGMRRLGVWDQTHSSIDMTDAPLVDKGYIDRDVVAHVALVYANLEDVDAVHYGSAVDAGVRSLFASWRYLSLRASPGWLGDVVRGLSRGSAKAPTGPSLRVRADVQGLRRKAAAAGKSVAPNEAPPNGGLLSTFVQLENDVCAYVCRNDLRTRVRGFVGEALVRLCTRKDVKWVIVNAHSQGTVVAYDVLRGMPPAMAARIPAVYTHAAHCGNTSTSLPGATMSASSTAASGSTSGTGRTRLRIRSAPTGNGGSAWIRIRRCRQRSFSIETPTAVRLCPCETWRIARSTT
jgi:hypothetical protein